MAVPSPWNTGGTANSLADAIRRQAERMEQQSKSPNEIELGSSGGPLDRLADGIIPQWNSNKDNGSLANGGQGPLSPFEQLLANLNGIQIEPTPIEVLRQQAEEAANLQFNPLISALKNQMGQTKERGRSNQKEARQMYGGLAQDIAAQIPAITERMNAASEATEDRYNQTQQMLQGQYDQQAQNQAAIFKKLGIQAAAPAASQGALEDQAYFQNQSAMDEDAALQMLEEMTQTDVTYNRDTSNNTRLAGENTAQGIGQQLEQYLQTAGNKLGALQASRQSAISQMLAQLQGQDSERMQEAEQDAFQRQMALAKLQMDMQKMMMGAAGSSGGGGGGSSEDQLFDGTSGLSGASNYLAQQYGPNNTFSSNSIMDAINDVLADPRVVAGKYNNENVQGAYGNSTVPVNNEFLIQLLRKRMTEGDPEAPLSSTQYSQYDINNAINALLAYKGDLR